MAAWQHRQEQERPKRSASGDRIGKMLLNIPGRRVASDHSTISRPCRNLERLAEQAQLLQAEASIEQQLHPGAALRIPQSAIELPYECRVVFLLQMRREGAWSIIGRHSRCVRLPAAAWDDLKGWMCVGAATVAGAVPQAGLSQCVAAFKIPVAVVAPCVVTVSGGAGLCSEGQSCSCFLV